MFLKHSALGSPHIDPQHSQGTWECGVCFEEALGRNCVRLSGCSHVFCAECVGSHCSIHVREGSVSRLTCLAFKCTSELSQQVSSHCTLYPALYPRSCTCTVVSACAHVLVCVLPEKMGGMFKKTQKHGIIRGNSFSPYTLGDSSVSQLCVRWFWVFCGALI